MSDGTENTDNSEVGLRDFPDRLSPMLVKELRQGLRTKAFTGTFLFLQITVGLFVLMQFGSTDHGRAGEAMSRIIFAFFSVAVLVIQPMRGLAAVSSEIKENTLDLMVLTRLSSWKILLGKWASLVGQSALLYITLLPYLVIRYFFGGMQLFAELALFGAAFLMSAAVTGVFVGFSANRSVILRGALFLAGGFAGFGFLIGLIENDNLFDELTSVFSDGQKEELWILIGFVVLSLYIGYYFLEMGATRIATLAETTALRKRLAGIGMILATCILFALLDISYVGMLPAYFVSLWILAFLAIDCFTEEPPTISRVLEPLATKGIAGRAAGLLFYRGWHTGFLLIVFLAALLSCLILGHKDVRGYGPDNRELWILAIGSLYAFLMPLLIVQIFRSKFKDRFNAYLVILFGSFALCALCGLITEFLPAEKVILLSSFLPGMFIGVLDVNSSHSTGMTLLSVYLLMTLAALGFYAFREFRNTFALQKAFTRPSE